MTTTNDRLFFPPSLPRLIPTPQPVTTRRSCEAEIRAIGDRLRLLIATDNDAARHIEEQCGDMLATLPKYTAEMEDALTDRHEAEIALEEEKAALSAVEEELVLERSANSDMAKKLAKWDEAYGSFPDPLTPEETRTLENVEAFMHDFRAADKVARELFNS